MPERSWIEDVNDGLKKRQFLKQAATSTAAASGVIGGLNVSTGTARATTRNSDDDSCECKYEDKEWDPGIDEVANRWGDQTSNGMSWANPGWSGFDICEDVDPENNGKYICVKTADEVTEDNPDCADGKAIYTFNFDMVERDAFNNGNVVWSYSIWIGVDNDGCVWVGEDSGQCSPISGPCNAYEAWRAIDDDVDDAIDYVDDVVNEIEDRYTGPLSPAEDAVLRGLIYAVLVLVIGAALLAPGPQPI